MKVFGNVNARQLDFIAALEGLIPPLWKRAEAGEKMPSANGLPELEETARELLRGIGCEKLARRVNVVWHPRLRTTAGQAFYGKNQVRMNPKLMQFGMEEVDKTLRHELAHLVARYRAGGRRIAPHGAEWQEACRELGLAGEKRCHDLPLPRVKQRERHRYRCSHCGREYGRVRAFRRAVACLECCRAYAGGRYHERYRLVKVRSA